MFAILVLTIHPVCTLACNVDQYYTPKTCVMPGVTAPFECRTCPANSLQISAEFDEACVCNSGFSATGASYRCSEYKGNGGSENVIWPKVPDSFTCTACSASPGAWCTGGWHRYVELFG
jgi:hypothetical protein